MKSDDRKSGEVDEWISRIENARKDDGMDRYETRCKLIRKKYLYEGSALVRTRKYQMLWSNIQTMQSSIYSQPPQAVVSRRYRDSDPIARTTTEILERAINFTFDAADFDTEFKMVRDDFLLYARGVARVYYEPEYETENDFDEDITDAFSVASDKDGPIHAIGLATGVEGYGRTPREGLGPNLPISPGRYPGDTGVSGVGHGESAASSGVPSRGHEGDTAEGATGRTLKFENVRIRFVHRLDFRHQTARSWSETEWIAFRAYLTRDQVSERFGEDIGKKISLDADPMGDDDDGREKRKDTDTEKAAVWEVWDKQNNEVIWVSPGYPDVLEAGPPYLDLEGFYPCPRPAYGTLVSDSLVPVPDFIFYQDQSEEIDQLTARMGALSDALKLVGFYPAGPQGEGSPEIEKAMSPGFENKLIAVQAFSSFLEGGGGKGAPVVWMPVEQVISVLEGCVKLRQQLVEDVYQIIGISDIMRGATDPQETEGAQQLKAQYGGTRVKDRQTEIARFCRDIARLVGQVIAQYCSPATIMEMTNMKLPTERDVMMARLVAAAQAQQVQLSLQPQQGMATTNGMPQGMAT